MAILKWIVTVLACLVAVGAIGVGALSLAVLMCMVRILLWLE